MATESDSYTTTAAVEGRLQKAFSGSTRPTSAVVLDFMAKRAAEIQAIILEVGLTYTVPSGASPFPGTMTAAEATLKTLCDLANELAAAGDAVNAHDTTEPMGFAEEAKAFWEEANAARRRVRSCAESLFRAAQTKTHTDTGGISKSTFADTGSNAEPSQGDLFGLGRKW